MRKLKYLLILVLSIGLFNSCLVDDETPYDDNDTGFNLATFELGKTMVSGIADGTEYVFPMKIKIVGPTLKDLKSDISVTVAVDESSTAIDGTHFRIDQPTVALNASNNYLNVVNVTMTTTGIITPLAKNPVLVLKVVSATGDANVTNTAKKLEIDMNFACYSEFEGVYTVVTTSSSGALRNWTETITKTGVEEYLTQRVGTWNPPLNPDYGFVFNNACNVITVPLQGLADMYSNEVWSHKPGEANPDNGVLTIYYTIAFADGDVTYTAIFTPVVK
jgi:hypothetical protein